MKGLIYSKKKEAVYRVIESEAVVLTVHDSILHTLNEVGTFIWEQIDGKSTIEDIVEAVCDAYDSTEREAAADVDRFLKELLRRGLVTVKKRSS